jgi:hypothetical protein
MKPILLGTASALAAWASMAILCFRSSSQRHRMGLREQGKRQRRQYLAAAILLLSLSLLAATAVDGTSFGILLWICQTGIVGLALLCALPYSVTAVTRTSRAAALLAPVLFALAYRF